MLLDSRRLTIACVIVSWPLLGVLAVPEAESTQGWAIDWYIEQVPSTSGKGGDGASRDSGGEHLPRSAAEAVP